MPESVVLITGSNGGFGRRTALAFARADHTVVASMRDVGKGAALVDEARAEGLALEVVALDVGDAASVAAAVDLVLGTHGRIDVLVNNAGIGIRGAVEDATDDDVRAVFEVNYFGLLRVTRAVLPAMRRQRGGVVVNVSSIAGIFSTPFASVYSSSKAAVESVSDALHYELAPFGIRVAVVEPGIFPTDFATNRRPNARGDDSPYRAEQDRWNAAYARRPGGADPPPDPDAVAAAIVSLATDGSAPLRTLIGRDAEVIGAMRISLDDVAFERELRRTIDFPVQPPRLPVALAIYAYDTDGMETIYQATVHSSGDGRNGHVQSDDGLIDADVRMPTEMGGSGGATNPEQLFAAGNAACFHSALRAVAGEQGLDVAGTEVSATVGIGKADSGAFQLAVELDVSIPAADRATAETAVAAAHQMCPYSNATRGNVDVVLKVV